jgi:hypothetical protein
VKSTGAALPYSRRVKVQFNNDRYRQYSKHICAPEGMTMSCVGEKGLVVSFMMLAILLLMGNVAYADEIRIGAGAAPTENVLKPVKSPETPEVARPITLLTKGAPSADVQKLLDFIKGEGQKYIK